MPRVREAAMAGSGVSPWLAALRGYLATMLLGNLAWEAAHLPLYTIWTTGTARENLLAVLHCTGGDVLIAASALLLALVLAGDSAWPHRGFRRVMTIAILLGFGYTVFSEWLNIVVRRSWEYSELMPVVPLFGFALGLSPLLQWLAVPAAAFAIARHRAAGAGR